MTLPRDTFLRTCPLRPSMCHCRSWKTFSHSCPGFASLFLKFKRKLRASSDHFYSFSGLFGWLGMSVLILLRYPAFPFVFISLPRFFMDIIFKRLLWKYFPAYFFFFLPLNVSNVVFWQARLEIFVASFMLVWLHCWLVAVLFFRFDFGIVLSLSLSPLGKKKTFFLFSFELFTTVNWFMACWHIGKIELFPWDSILCDSFSLGYLNVF